MGRLIDADSAYTVLTDYYHHKTDAQHMALKDALDKVKTVPAIPIDWINDYADLFGSDDVKAMLEQWKLEDESPACGPDYCEIGGDHE